MTIPGVGSPHLAVSGTDVRPSGAFCRHATGGQLRGARQCGAQLGQPEQAATLREDQQAGRSDAALAAGAVGGGGNAIRPASQTLLQPLAPSQRDSGGPGGRGPQAAGLVLGAAAG